MLVKKAALKYLNKEKEGHKKVKNIVYKSLNIQPYLTSKLFTREERNLMYSLRSNCHPAKNNFKRMNKNNLLCSLGCQNIEDQIHIFTQCPKIKVSQNDLNYENIFKDVTYQKETIELFLKVEKKRKYKLDNISKNNLPPGGATARTRADQATNTVI